VDAVLAAIPGAGAATDSTGDQADHSNQMWETLLNQPPDPEHHAQLSRSTFGRALIFYVLIRLIRPFFRLRASGQQHIPATGPYILSPNHQSYLDAFLMLGVVPFRTLRQVFAVGAAEYYQTPFMKGVARFTNVIPVDADSNLESAMRAGATGLRLGKVLILFPEGERTIDGELKTFKKGAPILSAHLNAPVVPVAMDGLFELWPRSRSFQWRRLWPGGGARVVMQFGEPISVARGQYAEGTAALRAAVERMFAGIRRRPVHR
jgi:long-chain acyl-CoA synthetase